MEIRPDIPCRTSLGYSYVLHSHHRNGNVEKSQWTVTYKEEITLFEGSIMTEPPGICDTWSLRKDKSVVGRSPLKIPPARDLRIAKFVKNSDHNYWHGYPADYRMHAHDRPPIEILLKWHKTGQIEKHEISKVRRGQPCSLSGCHFGVVIDYGKSVRVIESDSEIIFDIIEFPVRWRVFPRSRRYLNHLHLILEDRIEIFSFNHDYFLAQRKKIAGTEVNIKKLDPR